MKEASMLEGFVESSEENYETGWLILEILKEKGILSFGEIQEQLQLRSEHPPQPFETRRELEKLKAADQIAGGWEDRYCRIPPPQPKKQDEDSQ